MVRHPGHVDDLLPVIDERTAAYTLLLASITIHPAKTTMARTRGGSARRPAAGPSQPSALAPRTMDRARDAVGDPRSRSRSPPAPSASTSSGARGAAPARGRLVVSVRRGQLEAARAATAAADAAAAGGGAAAAAATADAAAVDHPMVSSGSQTEAANTLQALSSGRRPYTADDVVSRRSWRGSVSSTSDSYFCSFSQVR